MMYTLEFSFQENNFSSTITNEDIEFGASSRPTDSASHMQGSVTFFQQSIYKNTAAWKKNLDTKFTQIQIVPPMQYQVMQTFK